MDEQDGVYYSESDKEAYANNFGSNLSSYTDMALDINNYDSDHGYTVANGFSSSITDRNNNHVGNDSEHVLANNTIYDGLDKSEGDFQLNFAGFGDLSGQAELEQADLLVKELGNKASKQILENLSSEAALMDYKTIAIEGALCVRLNLMSCLPAAIALSDIGQVAMYIPDGYGNPVEYDIIQGQLLIPAIQSLTDFNYNESHALSETIIGVATFPTGIRGMVEYTTQHVTYELPNNFTEAANIIIENDGE
jgi:hypothetical protein